MSTLRGIILICWLYAVGALVATAATVEIRGSVTMLSGSTTNTVTVTNYTTNSVTNVYSNYACFKTSQTNVWQAGDDGYYQNGAFARPRFTILVTNGDYSATNCAYDNLTGLTWGRSYCVAGLTFTNAMKWCEGQSGTSNGMGGWSDWRMPNANELLSICCWQIGSRTQALWNTAGTGPQENPDDPFTDVNGWYAGAAYFWSSTLAKTNTVGHFLFRFSTFASVIGNDSTPYCILPVRGP